MTTSTAIYPIAAYPLEKILPHFRHLVEFSKAIGGDIRIFTRSDDSVFETSVNLNRLQITNEGVVYDASKGTPNTAKVLTLNLQTDRVENVYKDTYQINHAKDRVYWVMSGSTLDVYDSDTMEFVNTLLIRSTVTTDAYGVTSVTSAGVPRLLGRLIKETWMNGDRVIVLNYDGDDHRVYQLNSTGGEIILREPGISELITLSNDESILIWQMSEDTFSPMDPTKYPEWIQGITDEGSVLWILEMPNNGYPVIKVFDKTLSRFLVEAVNPVMTVSE